MTALMQRWVCIAVAFVAGFAVGWLRGAEHEEAARDLIDAQRVVIEAQTTARTARRAQASTRETANAIHANALSTQEKTRADQSDRARAAADLRAGTTRLSVPVVCPDNDPGSTATGREHDAATRAELPGATAADLVELAGEADDVVRQLGQCKATILEYRDQVARWHREVMQQ